MTRRLLLSYVSITLVVLAVLVLPLGAGYADRASAALLAGVERDANAVADLVTAELAAARTPSLDGVLAGYAARGGRIVVVTRDGDSVGDSDLIGEPSRDFSTRPEMALALGKIEPDHRPWKIGGERPMSAFEYYEHDKK